MLKEHEAGAKTADLARKHGVSEATLYNWKAKYGGMDVSEAKRLKQLEDENAKLKKLLAEQMLDVAALRAPDTSISGRRVARELTALIERRGKPGMIVSDNGPSSPRTPCSPGRRTTESSGTSLRRESRCRTGSARVSTAACSTSF